MAQALELSVKYFKLTIINMLNNFRKRDGYFRRKMETLKIKISGTEILGLKNKIQDIKNNHWIGLKTE